MTLKWFEPDLLLVTAPALRPLWMDNYRQFILELQTNFGPHDPVRDAEHQLDHLTMTDGQRITKYIVEFNHIASQIQGYGEGALWHHFYNGLPNHIKDEISCVGKPTMLSNLQQLASALLDPKSLTSSVTLNSYDILSVFVLVDSGSSDCFIDTTFVNEHVISTYFIPLIQL